MRLPARPGRRASMSREAGLGIEVVALCGRDEGVHGRGAPAART